MISKLRLLGKKKNFENLIKKKNFSLENDPKIYLQNHFLNYTLDENNYKEWEDLYEQIKGISSNWYFPYVHVQQTHMLIPWRNHNQN